MWRYVTRGAACIVILIGMICCLEGASAMSNKLAERYGKTSWKTIVWPVLAFLCMEAGPILAFVL